MSEVGSMGCLGFTFFMFSFQITSMILLVYLILVLFEELAVLADFWNV